MKKCRSCGCELANDARFCSTCGTASGRTDSQPVLGTHVDWKHPDSGNERFIDGFNLSQKKIGLGLTALAVLVIILVAVTGPSFREVTDPILVFVSLWMFFGGFVWLIVVAVRHGQKRYAGLTMTAGLIVVIVGTAIGGTTVGGSAPGTGGANPTAAPFKVPTPNSVSLTVTAQQNASVVESAKERATAIAIYDALPKTDRPRIPTTDLEIDSFDCVKEPFQSMAGGYAYIRGEVTNTSGTNLDRVTAVASWYTSSGDFVTSDMALIQYQPILAGQTSPFEVGSSLNPAMSRCKLEFAELFGGTISSKER